MTASLFEIQAYLVSAPDTVTSGGHLLAVLGVFQKLIASKAHDHEGFAILDTLIMSLPLASYEAYMGTVWGLLFRRLQVGMFHRLTSCMLSFESSHWVSNKKRCLEIIYHLCPYHAQDVAENFWKIILPCQLFLGSLLDCCHMAAAEGALLGFLSHPIHDKDRWKCDCSRVFSSHPMHDKKR